MDEDDGSLDAGTLAGLQEHLAALSPLPKLLVMLPPSLLALVELVSRAGAVWPFGPLGLMVAVLVVVNIVEMLFGNGLFWRWGR